MYAMTGTRPDIAFAVGKLSQYSHDPANRHRITLDRVLRYLHGTSKLGLVYDFSIENQPVGYADSAYGDDLLNRKTTHGMFFMLSNASCI